MRPCHSYYGVRTTACLALCVTVLAASAQEAAENSSIPHYTLEQCIELGLERSIPLANARCDAEIGETTVRQVRSQVFPSLDVESSYTRLDEAATFPGITKPFGREDNYRVGVSADQLLYSGGSVRAALQAAKSFRATTAHEVARRHATLVRDITKTFYGVLFAEASVEVSRESVRQLEEFERQSHLKYENETLSEFDWLSARVKLSNEKARLVRERNDLDLTKTAFRNFIYLDDLHFELDGELTYTPVETDLEQLYEIGQSNRPELLQAKATIRLREADVRVSKGSYFPEFRAFANYQGDNPGYTEPAADEWEWHWNAGLSASWSFLDGGLRRAAVREKSLEEAKARASLEDLQRVIRLEIQSAFLTLNNAAEVVSSSQEGVDLALKALEIARLRYDKGLSTYLEFTDSNLALSTARLIHYGALRSYLQALADLRFACGIHDLPKPERAR